MTFTVLPGPLLRDRTTLRLGGRALAEILVSDTKDVDRLALQLKELGGQPLALGRGSNLLARDRDLPLVLVRMRQEPRPEIVSREESGVLVKAPAGMRLPRLLQWLCARELSGLEGLSGVPGDVGGAAAMNAGSFGCTMGACLERVQIVRHGDVRWVPRSGFTTAYRSFKVENDDSFYMITAVMLRLRPGNGREMRRTMQEYMKTKRATQPITAWTAGCAFKNPAPDAPAGMLLERVGLKGYAMGGMRFSPVHANFLENTGKGTSDAALELLQLARQRVRERFDYNLELEVRICPHD